MITDLRDAPSWLTQTAQWHNEQWGWMFPGESTQQRILELQYHLVGDPIPSTLLAFHNNLPAGCVSLIAHDMPEYPALSPWLSRLFVPSNLRDKGIGTQLLREAERMAYRAGYDALFLYTYGAYEWFYQREWEPVHNLQRPRGQVTLMQRDLTSLEDLKEEQVADDEPEAR